MDINHFQFDENDIQPTSEVFDPTMTASMYDANDPFYNIDDLIEDSFYVDEDYEECEDEMLDETMYEDDYFLGYSHDEQVNYGSLNEDVYMNLDEHNISRDQPVDQFYDYSALSDDTMFDKAIASSPNRSPNIHGGLHVGMTFDVKASLHQAVRYYSILKRVNFEVSKSCSKKWKVICKRREETGCQWYCRATCGSNSKKWKITVIGPEHSCFGLTSIDKRGNRHLNVMTIALHMKDKIKCRLDFSPTHIIREMKTIYQISVSYRTAWRGRVKALEMLFGGYKESFNLLPHYMQVLQATNPGTVVDLQVEPNAQGENIVERVFWAFGPCIEAFRHCVPVLTVDGTHLYGKYKGVLLVAVAMDAEHHLLPVAFGVVDCENHDNWDWFLSLVRDNVTKGANTCIISDRHKGLISAMSLPKARGDKLHMYCLRHMCSNFNNYARNKDLKENLDWIARTCRATKHWELFRSFRDTLHQLKNDAPLKWFEEACLMKSKWTLLFDEDGKRWGTMTSNAAECFNNILLGCRDLPITAIVQFTFSRVNKFFHRSRAIVAKVPSDKSFVPYVEKLILAKRPHALSHSAKCFDYDKGMYQVITRVHGSKKKGKWKLGRGGNKLIVSLKDRTCSCGKWRAYHYPCSHVMAVCMKRNESYMPYIDPHFSMEAYKNTWLPTFNPIPDADEWPQFNIPLHVPHPKYMREAKGRPRTKRFKNEMDKCFSQRCDPGAPSTSQPTHTQTNEIVKPPRTMTCSSCGGKGHNKKGCIMNK